MKEVLTRNIDILQIDNSTINKLNKENINKIYELCILSKKTLKEYGLSIEEINNIIVKLQLQGLDISKKYKI